MSENREYAYNKTYEKTGGIFRIDKRIFALSELARKRNENKCQQSETTIQ